MTPNHWLFATVGFALLGIAGGYTLISIIAVLAWRMGRCRAPGVRLPAVTLLKPLCGAEPGLYENLRSFCRQEYPQYQVVFGVRDPADPALAIVERLKKEFPSLTIDVVVDPRLYGHNYKNSNLMNMLLRSSHDVLAIADSDTWVGPDYLATVTAPLLDPRVGLVTCLYRDVPTVGIWSRLGAMYINEWYAPSVLLAWLFGHQGYASGQTLCLRRDTLEAIGGLRAIADHLADDYRLGELIRALGLQIVLSRYEVQARHHEPDLESLLRHELRWMRTIRVLRPRSFRMIFLSFSLPLAVFGLTLTALAHWGETAAWALFIVTLSGRLALHFVHRLNSERSVFADLWLLAPRDLFLFWIWYRSFFTSQITWRGSEFHVDASGVMRRVA